MEFSQETMSLLFNKLNYESLPQNILASMVNDLSKQNKDLKEKLKDTEAPLAYAEYKEMEKQVELADKDFVDMKNKLEKIILSKDNQIMDLEREVSNNKEEIDTLVKMTTKKKKKKTNEDENNEQGSSVENKIIHFQNFIEKYCQWSAKRVTKWDPCTKMNYKLAPGSGDRLFDSFRIYCVANNIISDVCRNSSTTIPTKKEFMELIVQEHKERYPNDWCQKNKQYPQSPNGSYTTPRVNLILIKDPKTGEELFKK
jgi:hypothetical protein